LRTPCQLYSTDGYRRPCQYVDFLANLLDRKSTACKTKQHNSFLKTNIFRALLKSLVHASFLVVWSKVISFTVTSQRPTHLLIMFIQVLKSFNSLIVFLSIGMWQGGVWYFVLWRYIIIVFSIDWSYRYHKRYIIHSVNHVLCPMQPKLFSFSSVETERKGKNQEGNSIKFNPVIA